MCSPSVLTFYLLQQMIFSVTDKIYSCTRFQSWVCSYRTNYRCVQSPNISVDVAKCGENFHKFTQYTHFLSVTKNDLSWLNNTIHGKFQLISMSSYAKNKLQMCSVTQHQYRRRQMWGKFHNSPCTLTFYLLQKMTCLDGTIYSW